MSLLHLLVMKCDEDSSRRRQVSGISNLKRFHVTENNLVLLLLFRHSLRPLSQLQDFSPAALGSSRSEDFLNDEVHHLSNKSAVFRSNAHAHPHVSIAPEPLL